MKRTLLLFAALFTLLPLSARAQTIATRSLAAGAHFEVGLDAARGGLVVRAVGQEALDLLHPASPAEAARRRAYNQQAEALFEGLYSGATAPIEAALGAPRRPGTSDVAHMLTLYRDRYGVLTGHEVLGSVPHPRGGTYTYVNARFGSQNVVFRLMWKGDQLRAFYPGHPAYTTSPLDEPTPLQTVSVTSY